MKIYFLPSFAALLLLSAGMASAAVISTGATVVRLVGGTSSNPSETPEASVDGLMQKFYSPGSLPTLQLTPTIGMGGGGSIVTAVTIFTANDTPGRDPTAFVLSGSNDGGATWVEIVSTTISLPDNTPNSNGGGSFGRNNHAGTTSLSSATNSGTATFTNTTAYTSYKFQVTASRGTTGSNGTEAQFAELQLIGTVIPEPSSILLTGLGGLGLLSIRRRTV